MIAIEPTNRHIYTHNIIVASHNSKNFTLFTDEMIILELHGANNMY